MCAPKVISPFSSLPLAYMSSTHRQAGRISKSRHTQSRHKQHYETLRFMRCLAMHNPEQADCIGIYLLLGHTTIRGAHHQNCPRRRRGRTVCAELVTSASWVSRRPLMLPGPTTTGVPALGALTLELGCAVICASLRPKGPRRPSG